MWFSTETDALPIAPDEVWEVLRDVTLLPRWHHFFRSVTLADAATALHPGHGDYVPSGALGSIHSHTAQPFTMSLGARSVVLRQPQPGRGEQLFSWWIEPGDSGTRIIQRIRISGRLSIPIAWVVGNRSAAGFAEDVRKLGLLLNNR